MRSTTFVQLSQSCYSAIQSVLCPYMLGSVVVQCLLCKFLNEFCYNSSFLGLLILCHVCVAALPKGVTSSWCRHRGLLGPMVIKDGTSLMLPESNGCFFLAGLTLNVESKPLRIFLLFYFCSQISHLYKHVNRGHAHTHTPVKWNQCSVPVNRVYTYCTLT